jgi:hypothetical protein
MNAILTQIRIQMWILGIAFILSIYFRQIYLKNNVDEPEKEN